MSTKISLNKLSEQQKSDVVKDLTVVLEQKGSYKTGNNSIIRAFSVLNEKELQTPYHYGKNKLNSPIINASKIRSCSYEFKGTLRTEQKKVKSEAIKILNSEGSLILSMHVGFGKCLAKGTKVLNFKGENVNVENVQMDDLLMGPDNLPRKVLGTCSGRQPLYKITFDSGESFTCNKSHILTLYDCAKKTFTDVSLKNFLSGPKDDLLGVLAILNYPDNYGYEFTGYKLGKKYAVELTTCKNWFVLGSKKARSDFLRGYFEVKKPVITDNWIFISDDEFLKKICRSVGIFIRENKLKVDEILLNILNGKNIDYSFAVRNFTVEKLDVGIYHGFELSGDGRFVLGNYMVTHNTVTAINIASKIRLPTLIVLNRILLLKQWIDAINFFCAGATVQHVTPKSPIKEVDFYLINAINLPKIKIPFQVGLMVVDECHMIVSTVLFNCLQSVCPKYLLGLSATPYRYDGLDVLLDAFFGEKRITKKLQRNHIVYKVMTKFKPEVSYTAEGRINWDTVLKSQAGDLKRNKLISKIAIKFAERNFLILCKRVNQAESIFELLKDKTSVSLLVGKSQEFNKEARILIATVQKCSVGFDHKKLDALILASDVEQYYIQVLGRVFRTEEVVPLIFDLVDDHKTLQKHYFTREDVYKEVGGTIKTFEIKS